MSQVFVPSSDSWDSADAETADLVASYRRTRDQIEREILPRATSVDGLRFACQASLHDLRLCRGGYVVLEAGGRQRLGQVTDLRVDLQAAAVEGLTGHAAGILVRMAGGSGVLLDTDGDPFHDAVVRPAEGGRGRDVGEANAPPAGGSRDRGAGLGTRRSGHPRQRGARSAHVPVRTVRVGQDLRARAPARTGVGGDDDPDRRARPELGLRPAGARPGGCAPAADGALRPRDQRRRGVA